MQNIPPRDPSQWADFLIEQDLPSISPAHARILAALEDENPSASKLAEQIRQDPVLCFKLIGAANKAFESRGDSVRSLVKAINVLGLGQIQQIVRAMQYRPELAESPAYTLYSYAITTSLLAARLAHALSPQHQPSQAEEISWCALLQGVPFWYLFLHAEERIQQLATLTPRLGHSADVQEILGCQLVAIGKACLERLPVPDLTRRSLPETSVHFRRIVVKLLLQAEKGRLMQIQDLDDRELKQVLHRPEFTATVANMLAWEAMEDWYSGRTEKAHLLAALAARAAVPNWITYSHNLAAEVSREHRFSNLFPPAARLLLTVPGKFVAAAHSAHASPIEPRPAPGAAEPPGTPPPEEPSFKSGSALFQELLQNMLTEPDSFADVAQLMNTAARAACFGIGFDRAVIALVNKQRSRLKGLYSAGTTAFPELARFEVDIEAPNLFRKLLEKSAAIWIKPSSSEKIRALLPPHFLQLCGRDEFLLMSTFMRDRPVAIVYADQPAGAVYTQEQYEQFKLLCQAVSFVLRQMADRSTAS